MSEMISFGGGVNSTAMIILLVEQGWKGPIVFADVGDESQPCEHPETLCFLTYFEREYLRSHGLELTRLQPGDEWHSKKASIGLYSRCLAQNIIPLCSVRWCSVEWKRDPIEKWRKAHEIAKTNIGICADEPRRVRNDPEISYPLVEHGVTRTGCIRIIEQAGLSVPRKSGCWFCPNQRLGEWRRLLFDHPELYEKAELLEENASLHFQKHATLDPGGESLRTRRVRRGWDKQTEFDLPDMARPCICGL